ncbi:MAG: biopolymer transporter ExbD [Deltaproteobacteria bacterium]|nr:biopolymer transporter ExbD [Deltaproteobacteria bacterium]
MEFERRRHRRGTIDLAPLVDVVFNLLLFFVITYNVTADPAIKVRLPGSHTADSRAEEPVVISVSREGSIYVDHEPAHLEQLSETVRQRLDGRSDPSVRIRADQDAPVGTLVRVVDAVRLGGCSAFSLVTTNPE